jgi:hypothetical protein
MDFFYPVSNFVGCGAAPINQILAPRIAPFPQCQVLLAQKVLVVQLQLFEAGAGDVG